MLVLVSFKYRCGYWYRSSQTCVSVLVSIQTIKICSIGISIGPELGIGIGIGIDIENRNIQYWNRYWYCLNPDAGIGIGIDIVFWVKRVLVLILVLKTPGLQYWYWYWYCKNLTISIGIGIGFERLWSRVLVLVLVLIFLKLVVLILVLVLNFSDQQYWYWYWFRNFALESIGIVSNQNWWYRTALEAELSFIQMGQKCTWGILSQAKIRRRKWVGDFEPGDCRALP